MLIFVLFKPLDIKQHNFKDVPLFEISSFTLYELDTESLTTIMKGDRAVRYNNRYTVTKIDYTDNSKEYIANMSAKNGIYKNDIVDLIGDVVYAREDGLMFKTDKATYNKKTNIAYTDGDFISYRADDVITGTSLVYNNLLKTATAKKIAAKYQLQEGKKWNSQY